MKNYPIALALLDTNFKYQILPHLKFLNQKLYDATITPSKIIVSLPPRHGKSELISKYFPAWYLMNCPDNKIMHITNSASFSQKYGRMVRDLIKNYGHLSPYNIELNPSSAASDYFAINNHDGEYIAVGVQGNIMGRGANIMIIDDPISSNESVLSINQRDKLYDWFTSTAFSRLESLSSVFIVMQRWHVDDIVGRLLRDDTGWDYICIPAIAEENDILNREPGEVLWESKWNLERLMEAKNSMKDFWFNAMYQQRPEIKEDAIFNRQMIKYYNDSEYDYIIQSYDTAFKDGNKNDFTACVTFGSKDNNVYVIDSWHKKLVYPDLKYKVIDYAKQFRVNAIPIEDKASGQSLIQDLKRETRLPIKEIKVTGDKVLRANMSTGYFDNLYFKENKNSDLISELLEFPFGIHDDLVDAFTQGLNYIKNKSSKPKIMTF